jgi:hypothetical protein
MKIYYSYVWAEDCKHPVGTEVDGDVMCTKCFEPFLKELKERDDTDPVETEHEGGDTVSVPTDPLCCDYCDKELL